MSEIDENIRETEERLAELKGERQTAIEYNADPSQMDVSIGKLEVVLAYLNALKEESLRHGTELMSDKDVMENQWGKGG